MTSPRSFSISAKDILASLNNGNCRSFVIAVSVENVCRPAIATCAIANIPFRIFRQPLNQLRMVVIQSREYFWVTKWIYTVSSEKTFELQQFISSRGWVLAAARVCNLGPVVRRVDSAIHLSYNRYQFWCSHEAVYIHILTRYWSRWCQCYPHKQDMDH
jgi:hypothetical protein